MPRRLKVAHLVHGLVHGGLENGVVNLCNGLDPERFEPSICTFDAGGELEARVNCDQVNLVEIRRHFGNDPSLPFRIALWCRRNRIDILHLHSWVTLVEGTVGAKLGGVPTVIHGEHGYPFETRPRNIPIQRWLWSRANQVLSVAGELADSLSTAIRFPRESIQVIPNGVDTELFQPNKDLQKERRSELSLPQDVLLLGMVARLMPVKNHAGVLKAIAELRQSGLDIHLALAGDGELRGELEQQAADLGIASQTHFLGYQSNVNKIYHAFDIFLLNSHREGMSNTIIEAMASGLPVVATRVGANDESVVEGESGYLIPPDDPQALAAAVNKLTSAEVRERFSASARERIVNEFSIQAMVRRYSELYDRFDPRRYFFHK